MPNQESLQRPYEQTRATVDALIFAGGVGSRMTGSNRPKQFLELSGKPVIGYTIEQFALHPEVTHVTVACLEGWMGYLERYLQGTRYAESVSVVCGGATGQESIFNGLEHIHSLRGDAGDAVVLVHDGVRPLIDVPTISACIRSVRGRGPTATVATSTETVVVTNDARQVMEVLPRSQCSLARAPQGFLVNELYEAHLRARAEGKANFIDSVSLMAHYGHPIFTVEGPAENIKVTTPMDYYAFKAYMEARDQSLLWGERA